MEIVELKISIYILLTVFFGYFMIINKLNFTPEKLLDYCVSLTSKIICFFGFIGFLIISILSLVGGFDLAITQFIQDYSKPIIFYSVWNFGIIGLFKLISFFINLFKDNDLFNFEFQGGKNK